MPTNGKDKGRPGLVTFGKYTVIEEVGRGGMGIVYKATDSVLGRAVAIKELVFGGTTTQAEKEEGIARFRREAQTAARLAHPNIVTVYDVGEDGGRHFMAMEFLTGRSLKDLLEKGGRLSTEQMLDIVRQICEGLDHAHAQGIVHRDIKPDNILLQPNGTVKITDFGIARMVGGMSSMTQTGTMLGTLAYISPEQLQNSKDVDGRADLFSLGCMLYELFTGVLPFDGGSIGGTILKIITEEPKPPRAINPGIPAAVEGVILKCLRKVPGERYQRASEILQDLGSLIGGGKIPAARGEAGKACANCNQSVAPNVRFCPNCGSPQGIGGTGSLPAAPAAARQPAPPAPPAPGQGALPSWMAPPPAATPGPSTPAPAVMPESPAPVRPAAFTPPPAAAAAYLPPEPTQAASPPAATYMPPEPAPTPAYAGPRQTVDAPSPYAVEAPPAPYAPAPSPVPAFSGGASSHGEALFQFVRTFGRPGSGKGEFFSARGVALSPQGYVFVADTQNGRVQVFDRLGQWHHVINGEGTKGMRSPCGVAIDSKGQVWVIDSLDARVRVFDSDGHMLGMFCDKGQGRGQFTTPGAIAISPSSDLVVISDPENYRLQLLDPRGNVKNVLGRHGTRAGEFRSPYGVAWDTQERIYVIDYGRPSVQVVDRDGVPRLQFGSRGAGAGQFSIPRGIAVDGQGRIIVADTLNHRLQIFDPKGHWIASFGGKGSAHGQFMGPETLAIQGNELYVLDKGNNRIQVFELP